jgi:hypothetical protein
VKSLRDAAEPIEGRDAERIERRDATETTEVPDAAELIDVRDATETIEDREAVQPIAVRDGCPIEVRDAEPMVV